MELLPFLETSSQWSAVIVVFMSALLGLQIKLQGQKQATKQKELHDGFAKAVNTKIDKLSTLVTALAKDTDVRVSVLESKVA